MRTKKVYEEKLKTQGKDLELEKSLKEIEAKITKIEEEIEKDKKNHEEQIDMELEKKRNEHNTLLLTEFILGFEVERKTDVESFREKIEKAIKSTEKEVKLFEGMYSVSSQASEVILKSSDEKKSLQEQTEKLNAEIIDLAKEERSDEIVDKIVVRNAVVLSLQDILNNHDGNTVNPHDKFLRTRAMFNLSKTKDPSVFNEYLPYRNSIKDDNKKLKYYEGLVKQIQANVDISFASRVFRLDMFDPVLAIKERETDASTQYLLPAIAAEIFHSRPELIDEILKPNNGNKLKIVITPRIYPDSTSGVFIQLKNTVCIECLPVVESYTTHYHCTVLHELIHRQEAEGQFLMCDGILPGLKEMNDKEGNSLLDKFLDARKELFEKYKAHRSNLPKEEVEKINNYLYDPATNLTNYSFKNHIEFLADTVVLFYKDPKRLKEASEKLYEVYAQYFGFDTLELRNETQLKKAA